MAGTFSQIYIQVVFAVQGRQNLLQREWRQEVFKYMAGIIKNKRQKPIIINGVEDHVHVFLGLKPAMALSDLVNNIQTIHPISSTNKTGSLANSTGRKATEPFPTAIPKSKPCIPTFKIRNSIINNRPSKRNTSTSSKNLKSNTMPNICSNGWNKPFPFKYSSLDNPPSLD